MVFIPCMMKYVSQWTDCNMNKLYEKYVNLIGLFFNVLQNFDIFNHFVRLRITFIHNWLLYPVANEDLKFQHEIISLSNLIPLWTGKKLKFIASERKRTKIENKVSWHFAFYTKITNRKNLISIIINSRFNNFNKNNIPQRFSH